MILKLQCCWGLFFMLVGDERFLVNKKISMHSADRESGARQSRMDTIGEVAEQGLRSFGGPGLVWGLSTTFCRMQHHYCSCFGIIYLSQAPCCPGLGRAICVQTYHSLLLIPEQQAGGDSNGNHRSNPLLLSPAPWEDEAQLGV